MCSHAERPIAKVAGQSRDSWTLCGSALRKRTRQAQAEGKESWQLIMHPHMLDRSDVIVCCRKFLAGWDEWRVCSVFRCRRISSEEFLQQLLSRATRNRPGTGKKQPRIYDLANHPDDVCAAVARFWRETRHFEGSASEANEMAVWIKEFN